MPSLIERMPGFRALLASQPEFLWDPNSNRDLVKRRAPASTAGTRVAVPDLGRGPRGYRWNGTSEEVAFADDALFSTAGGQSTWLVVAHNLPTTGGTMLGKCGASAQYETVMVHVYSGGNHSFRGERWRLDGGAVHYQVSTGTIPGAGTGLVTFFMDADEGTPNEAGLMANGIRTAPSAMGGDTSNGTGALHLGQRGDNSSWWPGTLVTAAMWRRRLGVSEMRYLDSAIRG